MNERALTPQPRLRGSSRRVRGTRRLLTSERGTAVVEFALIAPLLFVLVFGIIEFGRILNAYNQLTQLAGQGARAAAVNRNPDGSTIGAATGTVDNADCGSRTDSIQCQLSYYYAQQDSLSQVNACIPSVPGSVGDSVTVHTSYVYHFVTGLFGFAHITLNATQTERAEGTPSYTAGCVQSP